MTESTLTSHPIGIFDSGVGGLSIFREIRRALPAESLIYIADQEHVPYGPRSLEEVQSFAEGITRYLISRNSKLIVIACNAASAAALKYLRVKFPEIPFVGMEPAVKPAAEQTHTRSVGVLATQATFQGALYASVIERFAQGVSVFESTCPGLVAQIEKGELDTITTREILNQALDPMIRSGIDTVVLGCTHYPFVIPLIREIAGPGIRVIDPSPAVARQVQRLLDEGKLAAPQSAPVNIKLLTTGSVDSLQALLPTLLGIEYPVQPLHWVRTMAGISLTQEGSSSDRAG